MRKGWCPGALRPMRSGDGLIVRLRPSCGELSAAQACEIARCQWRAVRTGVCGRGRGRSDTDSEAMDRPA